MQIQGKKSRFREILTNKSVVILDGGLATQLEEQGHHLNSSLWSAELLLNNPQAIVDAHLAFLNAGAQIITCASYQASIQGFRSKGLSQAEAGALLINAIQLAEQAVESYFEVHSQSSKPLIAASVGPYGAYLADGSEYKGNYGVNNAVLKEFHLQRIEIFDQSGADILAFETVPSYQEAQVLAELLANIETPAWLSFSCRDGQHLNDGTRLEKAAQLFIDHDNVLALGANCTAPQYIGEIIKRIKADIPTKAIVVYPNSGEIYDAISKTWQSIVQPTDFAQAAKYWYEQGAQIIGGCCRIGPRQINELTKAFNK